MKTIKTRDFGDIEVSNVFEVTFKKPIFGFEQLKTFYLIPLTDPEQFTVLQSAEDENVAFTLTRPAFFLSDYVLDINDDDASLLEFEDHQDLFDFAILTLSDKIEDITMNILGPIVINMKNGYAVQSISNCSHYTTKCCLVSAPVESH